jgi:hypothetical protein
LPTGAEPILAWNDRGADGEDQRDAICQAGGGECIYGVRKALAFWTSQVGFELLVTQPSSVSRFYELRILKDRFPTEKEQDYKWSQEDPHGHWEAHKDDESLKKQK